MKEGRKSEGREKGRRVKKHGGGVKRGGEGGKQRRRMGERGGER